jgi:hypothetical protein
LPIGRGAKPFAYRPSRGPNIIALAKAIEPPVNFDSK